MDNDAEVGSQSEVWPIAEDLAEVNNLVTGDMPRGDDSVMDQKVYGTCHQKPAKQLRWGVNGFLAGRIGCMNRDLPEDKDYFLTIGMLESGGPKQEIIFYDTASGKPVFVAPRGRSWEEFVAESKHHGWPSFRDGEIVRENVRQLPSGEVVSNDGTHLGHNVPQGNRPRYCINVMTVAGLPMN